MTEKPNEERKAEKNLILNQSFSNQPSLQKTSRNITDKIFDLRLLYEMTDFNDKSKIVKDIAEFEQKLWLPADKSILIEDVEKIFLGVIMDVKVQDALYVAAIGVSDLQDWCRAFKQKLKSLSK